MSVKISQEKAGLLCSPAEGLVNPALYLARTPSNQPLGGNKKPPAETWSSKASHALSPAPAGLQGTESSDPFAVGMWLLAFFVDLVAAQFVGWAQAPGS